MKNMIIAGDNIETLKVIADNVTGMDEVPAGIADTHNLITGSGSVSRASLGDAVELMKAMDDNQFDIGIVDPPYFQGPNKREFYGHKHSSIGVKRVSYPITSDWHVPGKEYFDQLLRVTKNQIIWGVNYFDYDFGPGRIVWDKVNQETEYSDCELAYCSLHDSVRLFRFMWNGMLQGKSMREGHVMQGNKKMNEKRIHPTQKPIELYKWTFDRYVKPGQTILDTHLGSGSSRIAAYDMDIPFYGIEINPSHFKNHVDRMNQHVKQLRFAFK